MSEDLRILMVEDQEADAILTQRELRRQGLTFTMRRVTGDTAMIRALHDFAPDLVLSDFVLPGFSGLEALAILRKERPGVPLIFVSGTVGEEQAVELLKLGATDYVLKQNLTRLPASISRALREVQLERERRQAEEQYRAVVEKMEAIASPGEQMGTAGHPPRSVAHDLNNILAPILMAVSMLRNGLPEAERERMLTIIENSARRASDIMREAASGHGEERPAQPLEMSRLIKEVVQTLQNTWPENLRVKLAVEDDLWRVTGDAARIKQVIRSLCVHAREAMLDGGTLRLGVENQVLDVPGSNPPAGAKPGPYVVLEVSSSGQNVAAEAGGGEPGSELTAVQGIVERHDGFMQVIHSSGEGTTFKVCLPAAREETRAAVPAAPPPAGRAAGGAGQRILLVDDEETIRFAAKTVLSKNGYRVFTARDGADALKIFHAHADEIALVLTDVMMPVMDGMALIRALRQARPEVPIIASSGQNEKTRLAELQNAGVSTVLNKPYAADILLRTVSEVLGRRRTAAAD